MILPFYSRFRPGSLLVMVGAVLLVGARVCFAGPRGTVSFFFDPDSVAAEQKVARFVPGFVGAVRSLPDAPDTEPRFDVSCGRLRFER